LATILILRADLAYNQTYDETAHIACGMEWLSQGTYDYETLHPPLARVATAFFPYLFGARSQGRTRMAEEGTSLLNLKGQYAHNLLLSRLGVLPFFWLSCFLTYRWMQLKFGGCHGSIAVLLFAFCPVVLAHSSLATTDQPLVAMFLWALLCFSKFLEKPRVIQGVWATLSFGAAVLTKFSAIPFFLVSAIVLITFHVYQNRKLLRPAALQILTVMICSSPIIWAGYRFSYQPLFTPKTTYAAAQKKLDNMSPRHRALLVTTRIPAPEFFRGLYLTKQNGDGTLVRRGYLLGRVYAGGRLAFFPVAILVKTPLATLVLLGMGLFVCIRFSQLYEPEKLALLWAGLAGPLTIGVLGAVNIGLRHVLPIYPFVAMFGAIGAVWLWQLPAKYTVIGRAITVSLLAWNVASCLVWAPEFLPYFNEGASWNSGHILVDSDLDWGQDFYKLEFQLKDVPANDVWIDYFGDPTIVRHNSAKWHNLDPGQHPLGWVAVSETRFREHPELYGWLVDLPYRRVGHSIRLFHLMK